MILPEWTIAELQEKMELGELSARKIAELYLQRIEEVDKDGPFINSIIELNPDALDIADQLDEQRKVFFEKTKEQLLVKHQHQKSIKVYRRLFCEVAKHQGIFQSENKFLEKMSFL